MVLLLINKRLAQRIREIKQTCYEDPNPFLSQSSPSPGAWLGHYRRSLGFPSHAYLCLLALQKQANTFHLEI